MGSEQFRELILSNNLARARAPIDPKTGDVYFPEAKLYLPKQVLTDTRSSDQFFYMYHDNELAVASVYDIQQASNKLIAADNLDVLSKNLPKYQACSNGMVVMLDQSNKPTLLGDSAVLKATARLENGRSAHIYLDNECPEMNDKVETLKGLKPY